jgi:carbonic anhydrase/acetyltransferase-like protein (isoleucine patch superfamily)
LLLPFEGRLPQLAPATFVAPGAQLIGDLVAGAGASFWYNVVVRADVMPIRIGARVNVQDLSVIHVTSGTHATTIGDDVTIGHRAIVHGCTVEAACLIGMGAIVMDGAVVGSESIIGAGAIVTPGTVVPPRSLVIGTPGKVRRSLTDKEVAKLYDSAQHYVLTAQRHLASLSSI